MFCNFVSFKFLECHNLDFFHVSILKFIENKELMNNSFLFSIITNHINNQYQFSDTSRKSQSYGITRYSTRSPTKLEKNAISYVEFCFADLWLMTKCYTKIYNANSYVFAFKISR